MLDKVFSSYPVFSDPNLEDYKNCQKETNSALFCFLPNLQTEVSGGNDPCHGPIMPMAEMDKQEHNSDSYTRTKDVSYTRDSLHEGHAVVAEGPNRKELLHTKTDEDLFTG